MELHFSAVDIDWVRLLRFDEPSLGIRTDRLQCFTYPVPDMDWEVFNFVAPFGHGLWLLRTYRAFDDDLRKVFFTHDKKGNEDSERVLKFEAMLKKHRVPKRSNEVAFRCFGLYPRLWGDRFSKNLFSSYPDRRFLSVAVPSAYGEATRQYFIDQVACFGMRCISAANDGDILFNTSAMDSTPDGRLLLRLVSQMTDMERNEVRGRLRGLVESADLREEFAQNLMPGMKISGAYRYPDRRDIRADIADDCIEIARLRAQLICRLKWPHALEWMRGAMDEDAKARFPDVCAEIDAALAEFPIVSQSPISFAGT